MNLLREMQRRQVSLAFDNSGRLLIEAPEGELSVEFIEALRAAKPLLIEWLSAEAEQPAVSPARRAVCCATCRHLIPNLHSPRTGYAECSAGLGYHWPQANQVCNRHKSREQEVNG